MILDALLIKNRCFPLFTSNHPLSLPLCSITLSHSSSSSTSYSASFTMSKTFAASEVASHKKPDDLWVIVDEDVYDLTKFQDEHPGGKKSVCLLEHRRVTLQC